MCRNIRVALGIPNHITSLICLCLQANSCRSESEFEFEFDTHKVRVILDLENNTPYHHVYS